MAKRGRKIPEGEDRSARDVQVTIYVTEAERAKLDEVAENLGFRSKSALIAGIIEPLAKDGFSGWGFIKLGNKFANRIAESQKAKIDLKPFLVFRRAKVPESEAAI